MTKKYLYILVFLVTIIILVIIAVVKLPSSPKAQAEGTLRQTGSLRLVGSLATKITDIKVRNGYGYGISEDYYFNKIIDVSNPSNPREISYDSSLIQVSAIEIPNDDLLYVATTAHLRVFSISDPTAPVQINEVRTGIWNPWRFEIHDNLLIDGFGRIFDISVPVSPTLLIQLDSYATLFVSDNYVYGSELVFGDGIYLEVFDISNLTAPVRVNYLKIDEYPSKINDFSKLGNKYLIASDHTGSIIIDISHPKDPFVVSKVETEDYFDGESIKFMDSVGFTNCRSPSFRPDFCVYDFSDPLNPFKITSLGSGGSLNFEVKGKYIYLPKGNLLEIYEFTSTEPPTPTPTPTPIPTPTAKQPVVLVHGLNDTAAGWSAYVGDNGFLASIGRQGFAADNLDTGGGQSISNPFGWTTNTIDENARLLGEYITMVKAITKSPKVDIVAHSMGGLIARRYIAHYMNSTEPDVNQLIMLGTPNAGSRTAAAIVIGSILPTKIRPIIAGLGWDFPAIIELTPTYLSWWNLHNSERHGVRFYGIAGNLGPVLGGCLIQNPLESTLNDIVVASTSVFAIPLENGWLFPTGFFGGCNGWHTGMRSSESGLFDGGPEIFSQFVKPLLEGQQPPNEASNIQGATITNDSNPIQFSGIQTGTIRPSNLLEFTWDISSEGRTVLGVIGQIDKMRISLQTPNGQLITPDTQDLSIKYWEMDKEIFPLVTYTISNTQAGIWKTIIEPISTTPADGLPVVAFVGIESKLRLQAIPSTQLYQTDQPVLVKSDLRSEQTAIQNANVTARLLNPDNTFTELTLVDDGQHNDEQANDGIYGNQFIPRVHGVYGGVIKASGTYAGRSFSRIVDVSTFVERRYALHLPVTLNQAAPAIQPTATPTLLTLTATNTPVSATTTSTPIPVNTPTMSPTSTSTPVPATATPTSIPTYTPTMSPTSTSTPTPVAATFTPTPTNLPTTVPTPTPTATSSPTSTFTPVATATPSPVVTPTSATGCNGGYVMDQGPAIASFRIPPNCQRLTVQLWGAGGGGMWEGAGGNGGYLEAEMPVTPGMIIKVVVGQGGRGASCSSDTNGGGGGGHTSVLDVNGTPLLSAGGGGGGHRFTQPCHGGNICSLSGYGIGGWGFGGGGQKSDPTATDGQPGTGYPSFGGGISGTNSCGSDRGYGGNMGGGGGGGGTRSGYGGGGGGGGYPGGVGGASGNGGHGANNFYFQSATVIANNSNGAQGGTGNEDGHDGLAILAWR